MASTSSVESTQTERYKINKRPMDDTSDDESTKAMDKQFRKGETVEMIKLKSKANWNGKLATIQSFNPEKQRWLIQINFDDQQLALLQPKNLRSWHQQTLKVHFQLLHFVYISSDCAYTDIGICVCSYKAEEIANESSINTW